MQRLLWLSCLIAAAACGAAPASPARVPDPKLDPVLTALLAETDRRLVEQPDDGVLLYHRAWLMLALGSPPAASLAYLERLDAMGWSVPFAPVDFEPLAGDARYRALAASVAARAPAVERSTVAFTVPGKDLVPEGIAVDPASGTLYLSSIRRRTIIAIDRSGAARPFIPEAHGGVLGVLGMKVDPARGVLWAASHASSSMLGYRRGDNGENDGVYAFALADGRVVRKAKFPGGGRHLANDIAFASDGTLYLTDSAAGALYRMPPDRDELELVIPAGTFGYPNGIAMLDDDRVYVSDIFSLSLITISTRTVARVSAPPGVPTAGFDGMLLHDGVLLGVQGTIGTPRLVAIAVEGDRAVSHTVLEGSQRLLEQPTTTCLWDGALYTIANAQLGAFGPDGQRPGTTLADPRILRTPL